MWRATSPQYVLEEYDRSINSWWCSIRYLAMMSLYWGVSLLGLSRSTWWRTVSPTLPLFILRRSGLIAPSSWSANTIDLIAAAKMWLQSVRRRQPSTAPPMGLTCSGSASSWNPSRNNAVNVSRRRLTRLLLSNCDVNSRWFCLGLVKFFDKLSKFCNCRLRLFDSIEARLDTRLGGE